MKKNTPRLMWSPEEADRLCALGYSPNGTKPFLDAGTTIDQIEFWNSRHFEHLDAPSMLAYIAQGWDPETAKEWRFHNLLGSFANYDNRFADVPLWIAAGFTAEEAADWYPETGLATADYVATCKQMRADGITYLECPWIMAGFTKEDYAAWQFCYTPEEAQGWIAIGITDPEEANQYTEAGIHPKSYQEWLQTGLPKAAMVAWKKAHFEPQRAKEWYEVGFRSTKEACRWESFQFIPTKAWYYKKRRLTPLKALWADYLDPK